MKIKIIICIISAVSFLCSCNKEDNFNYPEGTVGISKITNYPTITLTGGEVISVVKGEAFTDPGATAEAGGEEVTVTTTGSVNSAEVGVYVLNYSATNSDGFSASASRTVVVIPAAEVSGVDISGTYMDPVSTTANATITKVAPGVYFTTNCWGNGSLAIIPAYFVCIDGSTLLIPLQEQGVYGHIETTEPGTYSSSGKITWTIIRHDFSPPLTLTKTWQKI